MTGAGYEVLWPRGQRVTAGLHLAKRLDTLQGKTVGELWDRVFRGDEMYPVIERELAKRYAGIKFVGYDVFGRVHRGDVRATLAALPDKLKQSKVDAVICGVGC